jgi:multiple sugar transport system ATP-binding protein
MPGVTLERITKVYSGGVKAVDDVSMGIGDAEYMVLVGPSGCGKSTLLRMIAGLEKVTTGRILIGGDDATNLEPRERDIAMVFQSYALYPHKSVRENLGFGLRRRGTQSDETRRKVEAMGAMLGLGELMDRKPAALSGGQRQRVAMGRALVREPRVFLLDEPLSNLDAKLRTSMRGELARLHERLPTTTVYVTHDQVEAMTLGSRVAVMRDGVVQQCDSPQVLFDRPANLFVGAFIGAPAMNLVEARVEGGAIRFGSHSLEAPGLESVGGHKLVLGVRPTCFALADERCDPRWPRLTAEVDVVEELGAESNLLFTVDAPPVLSDAVREAIGGESGSDEGRLLADDRRARFTAQISERRAARAGERVELVMDPAQLHLFDAASGVAIEWSWSMVGAA